MSGIRGKDTKPEMIIRKALHAAGFRYRLHIKNLPGKPDLVFLKYKAVIFVHGCFWHGHKNCSYFRLPSTRTDFWYAKILGNQARDAENIRKLDALGWKVMVLWECATRQFSKQDKQQIAINMLAEWIANGNDCMEISCNSSKAIICSKISAVCSNASPN